MLAKLKRPHEVLLDKVDDILTLNFADLAGKQMQHTDSFFYKGFFFDLLPCYFDFLPCQHLDFGPGKADQRCSASTGKDIEGKPL